MKKDELDLEMEEMLKNARPLSEIDLEGLAEANRAVSRDPRHVAAVMKGVFVNDILCAMEKQGINKNQLAEKMGYTRQYLTGLLNKQDPRNFTIDTVVKLSMAVGLRPECICLEPMDVLTAQVKMNREKHPMGTDAEQDYTPHCDAEPIIQPSLQAADESYLMAA